MTKAPKPRSASIIWVFVFGFISLLVGILLDLNWLPSTPPSAPLLWINLVPGFWLLGVAFLAARFPQRRRGLIALSALLGVPAICVAGMLNWGAAAFEGLTEPVTNVNQYEHIVDPKNTLTAHFPERIPADAVDVHFYYLPAFMQGGSELLLRYRTSSSILDALLQKYSPVAIQVINGPVSKSQLKSVPHALTSSIELVGHSTLPDDFQVLILGASPPEDWNHGYSYGLAISQQRQEVIYWAETW